MVLGVQLIHFESLYQDDTTETRCDEENGPCGIGLAMLIDALPQNPGRLVKRRWD